MNEAIRLNRIREQLREQSEHGMIGVVAGYARVSEWVIRDWCDKPQNIPTQTEVTLIEDALLRMHQAHIIGEIDQQQSLI